VVGIRRHEGKQRRRSIHGEEGKKVVIGKRGTDMEVKKKKITFRGAQCKS
jgi:hypothetical protein